MLATPRLGTPDEFSVIKIILVAFLCLLVGHLALNTFISSILINFLAVIVITSILFWVLFLKRDVFGFILILFLCSQFKYANNQGGLFNLAASILSLAYLATNNVRETTGRPDFFNIAMLCTLATANIAGLILRNSMPEYMLILQAASFSSFLFTFYIASHIHLSAIRLKNLLVILAVMIAYNFVVSLNQHYSFLNLETPLLGLSKELFYATKNSFGTFGSSSGNAQFAMMVLAFLLPLLCASVTKGLLKLKPFYFVIIAILCVCNIVLANMRGPALESFLIIIMYSIMFSVFYRRAFGYSRHLTIFSFLLVFFLMTFGFVVGIENMVNDFQTIAISKSDDVVSGDAVNRREAWDSGITRLDQGSWWVGYGHGVFQSNQLAWGGKLGVTGKVSGGAHLHNLYLALPTLYGWIGSVAYLLLFLSTAYRLSKVVLRFSFDRLMVVACLGFLVSLIFFLIDEVKAGNAVQYINYPMIVFIWLGLANAAVRKVYLDQWSMEERLVDPIVKTAN